MSNVQYRNTLLKHFDAEVIGRLGLRKVCLEQGHEMEYPGSSIDNLFFIEEGVGSMTVTLRDGSQVETGMFGFESVVGVSALMGVRRSLNRVYMQVAGWGYASAMERACKEFDRGDQFHQLTLRYVQMQLTQSAQTAACNVKHDVEQRLARWLLTCADRANSLDFEISQEFLANMLGSARPSVSIAAGHLKQQSLIDYSRGVMHIKDMAGLEARACECYLVVRDHLHNLLEFDTGFVV